MVVVQKDYLTFVGAGAEFLRSTSTHGLRRIGWSRKPLAKAIWAILFTLAFLVYLVAIFSLLAEYFSYPTRTVVRKKVAHAYFPGVTICNVNPLRIAEVDQSVLEPYRQFTQTADWNMTAPGQLDPYVREANTFAAVLEGKTFENRVDVGHQLRHFVLHCAFRGRECNLDNDFIHVWNDVYGNCYTFGGGKHGSAFERQIVEQPGSLHGLVLILNTEPDEHLRSITESVGARLLVHRPTEMPFPEEDGISVPAGVETLIALRPHKHLYLGKPYTHCKKALANRYHYLYSTTACQKICKQEKIIEKCLCLDPKLPVISVYKMCSLNEIYSKEYLCYEAVMDNFGSGEYSCDCPAPCEDSRYDATVSYAKWPAGRPDGGGYHQALDDILFPVNGANATYRKNELVSAKVFYRDLSTVVTDEMATFPFMDFLTQFGGISSIFIGISLISIVEFLEFLLTLVTIPCINYMPWETAKRPRASGQSKTLSDRPLTAKDIGLDLAINERPLPHAHFGGKLVASDK